jgi:hypothetical protein
MLTQCIKLAATLTIENIERNYVSIFNLASYFSSLFLPFPNQNIDL